MTSSDRKSDHLELCATGDVGFHQKTTLLEQVELLHEPLPELAVDAIDLSVELLGKRLAAPILIGAMTGGTDAAVAINRDLASVAEEHGYGFALGSQRPMLSHSDDPSYQVRDVAPHCLLFGNLGAVQARALGTARVEQLCRAVGADALCIHLNPAQELVQPDGDRNFTGVMATLKRLVDELPIPLIVKETGCGISPRAAQRLVDVGVRHIDVSGTGGTSWVAVESARRREPTDGLGPLLREWGIPTAASVAYAHHVTPRPETIIASGGIATGLDVARAIALGANLAALARPVLRAHHAEGRDGVVALLTGVETALRAVMLLVGASDLTRLRSTPCVLGPELERWLAPLHR